jgi:hypothetical protein
MSEVHGMFAWSECSQVTIRYAAIVHATRYICELYDMLSILCLEQTMRRYMGFSEYLNKIVLYYWMDLKFTDMLSIMYLHMLVQSDGITHELTSSNGLCVF